MLERAGLDVQQGWFYSFNHAILNLQSLDLIIIFKDIFLKF